MYIRKNAHVCFAAHTYQCMHIFTRMFVCTNLSNCVRTSSCNYDIPSRGYVYGFVRLYRCRRIYPHRSVAYIRNLFRDGVGKMQLNPLGRVECQFRRHHANINPTVKLKGRKTFLTHPRADENLPLTQSHTITTATKKKKKTKKKKNIYIYKPTSQLASYIF